MKKIKTYIIRLLGGYTREDVNNEFQENAKYVRKHEALEIKRYLDLMNGKPADEWCKLAYTYIKRKAES